MIDWLLQANHQGQKQSLQATTMFDSPLSPIFSRARLASVSKFYISSSPGANSQDILTENNQGAMIWVRCIGELKARFNHGRFVI